VVGVGKARGELPLIVARNFEDPVVVPSVAGGARGGEKAVVESRIGPIDVVAIVGMLDLPVGDELHGSLNVTVFELRGEARCKRAGIVRLIASGGELGH